MPYIFQTIDADISLHFSRYKIDITLIPTRVGDNPRAKAADYVIVIQLVNYHYFSFICLLTKGMHCV